MCISVEGTASAVSGGGAVLQAASQVVVGLAASKRAKAQERALRAEKSDDALREAYDARADQDALDHASARDQLSLLARGLDPAGDRIARQNERRDAEAFLIRRYGGAQRQANYAAAVDAADRRKGSAAFGGLVQGAITLSKAVPAGAGAGGSTSAAGLTRTPDWYARPTGLAR